MRMLFASMMICCCAVAGYSQDQTEVCDASGETEVEVAADKKDNSDNNENGNEGETASVGTDSFSGCGCDKKPKI